VLRFWALQGYNAMHIDALVKQLVERCKGGNECHATLISVGRYRTYTNELIVNQNKYYFHVCVFC
jgi:hypothetical protein